MPSLFTHFLCGNKVLSLFKCRESRVRLLQNRHALNLGTQGPDILFYYRVWPWTKSHGIPKIGKRMHNENVRACFACALEYIMTRSGSEKDLLAAYLCGYICHYSLDLNTHPYIFYKTGFVRKGEPYTSKYDCYHRRFETAIDVLMLDRLLGVKPSDMRAHQLISISRNESEAVGRMLEKVLKNIYTEKVSARQISIAINDMVLVHKLVHDRTGLKKKLLCAAEKSLGHYPLMSSTILPPVLTDSLDYLNSSHAFWYLPWDKTQKRNSSFLEMFDAAVYEALQICEAILSCLYHTGDIAYALELIGNRSFSSGMDCSLEAGFKYFDCIFDKDNAL